MMFGKLVLFSDHNLALVVWIITPVLTLLGLNHRFQHRGMVAPPIGQVKTHQISG